jgi:hypothetical protein
MFSMALRQVEKDDDRRIADGGVMAGEGEAAGFAIDTEDGNVVAALVAAVEEQACGIEIEAPRLISVSPFFSDK